MTDLILPRRKFLLGLGAAAATALAAPAIVRAESIMRVVMPKPFEWRCKPINMLFYADDRITEVTVTSAGSGYVPMCWEIHVDYVTDTMRKAFASA